MTDRAAKNDTPAAHILVIGERRALTWILEHERMAFPEYRDASYLAVGDRLLLYTTRGCFHNPTRDRGRIIGEATVKSPVRALDEAVAIGDRRFSTGCRLTIESLARFATGVDLSSFVEQLDAFPDRASWSVRMRRVLVPLGYGDTRLLRRELRKVSGPPRSAKQSYFDMLPRST